MKLRNQLLAIAFMVTNVVSITNAYAGPEITGFPREPRGKVKIGNTNVSAVFSTNIHHELVSDG